MSEVKSICGAVNLLAAIFGADPQKLKGKFGLPIKDYYCSKCGKRLWGLSFYPYCMKCGAWVEVVCDECGRHFMRIKSDLITCIGKHDYHHIFCNRSCWGKYMSKFGFGAHPENRRKGLRGGGKLKI